MRRTPAPFATRVFLSLMITAAANAQWTPKQIPADIDLLLTVDFSGPAAGISGGWTFAGDIHGRAIYSSDAGKSWLPAGIPESTRVMVTMVTVDGMTAYCAGARNIPGSIARTPAGRSSHPKPLSARMYDAAIRLDGIEAYTGAFLKSTDGGKHWSTFGTLPDSIFYLLGACTTAPTTIIATADGSPSAGLPRVIRSLDGGSTWTVSRLPSFVGQLRSVAFMDCLSGAAVGYAAGDSSVAGVIATTHDGGDSWSLQTFPGIDSFTGVCFPTASTGYVVGNTSIPVSAVLLRTTDAGSTWNILPFAADSVVAQGISFYEGTGTGYVFGQAISPDTSGVLEPWGPRILKTTDGGLSWVNSEIVGAQTGTLLIGGTFLSQEEAFACGGDFFGVGVMFHTTNGGVSAVEPTPPGLPSGTAVWGNYPNPFNGETTIGYRIEDGAMKGSIMMIIYNVLGEVVARIDELDRTPGIHAVRFDASTLSAGVYFAGFGGGRAGSVHKLLLIR